MSSRTRPNSERAPTSLTGAGQLPLLSVRNIVLRFGGVTAVNDVSFDVPHRGICGLIGPNGAGKTSLFNCISRFYDYEDGDILLEGRSISRLKRHQLAALGLARTFQNLALFHSMSVRDNLLVGRSHLTRPAFLSNALRLPGLAAEEQEAGVAVNSVLQLLDLHGVAGRTVADLPFGTRKRVEMGRALMSRPKLLMLDEPAGGLSHAEVKELADLLRRLRESMSLTILLVEHHMNLVMRVSDKVVALEFGRKIADGAASEVQADPEVVRAYLGGFEDGAS